MALSIFDVFPRAVVRGVWELGTLKTGTIAGNAFEKTSDLDVVVDEGSATALSATPQANTANVLVYVKPAQLPTTSTAGLMASYGLHNVSTGLYYAIKDAGLGKNQETGVLEHVELLLEEVAL